MNQQLQERVRSVQHYEAFVNDILKTKLRQCLEKRESCCIEIVEYEQLETSIGSLKEIDTHPLKAKVDIGCNFFAKSEVPDTSKIFVSVGFGFFLEMTQEEAVAFIAKRIELLNSKVKQLDESSANIQVDIKLMLNTLAQLQNLEAVIGK